MDLDHLNLRVRDTNACRAFYERHFGFRLASGAEDGWFLRNDDGFVLALVATELHQDLPDGFHIGFGLDHAGAVSRKHGQLTSAGVAVSAVKDYRPHEQYVTFRCWDPDGTEIEVYWEAT